jgi:hypothetical protein
VLNFTPVEANSRMLDLSCPLVLHCGSSVTTPWVICVVGGGSQSAWGESRTASEILINQ